MVGLRFMTRLGPADVQLDNGTLQADNKTMKFKMSMPFSNWAAKLDPVIPGHLGGDAVLRIEYNDHFGVVLPKKLPSDATQVQIPTPAPYSIGSVFWLGSDVEAVLIAASAVGPGVEYVINNTLVDGEHINRIDNVVNRLRNVNVTDNYFYSAGKTVQWLGSPIEPRSSESAVGECSLNAEEVGFTFRSNLVEGATAGALEKKAWTGPGSPPSGTQWTEVSSTLGAMTSLASPATCNWYIPGSRGVQAHVADYITVGATAGSAPLSVEAAALQGATAGDLPTADAPAQHGCHQVSWGTDKVFSAALSPASLPEAAFPGGNVFRYSESLLRFDGGGVYAGNCFGDARPGVNSRSFSRCAAVRGNTVDHGSLGYLTHVQQGYRKVRAMTRPSQPEQGVTPAAASGVAPAFTPMRRES